MLPRARAIHQGRHFYSLPLESRGTRNSNIASRIYLHASEDLQCKCTTQKRTTCYSSNLVKPEDHVRDPLGQYVGIIVRLGGAVL